MMSQKEARETTGMNMHGKVINTGMGNGPDIRLPTPALDLMGSESLVGKDVYNQSGEDLGDIKEIMLDMSSGTVGYAVLSYGSFLGVGEKLFAVPWKALRLDKEHKCFLLDVDKDRLKNAPGFDHDNWPDMADPAWARAIHSYYGTTLKTEPLRL